MKKQAIAKINQGPSKPLVLDRVADLKPIKSQADYEAAAKILSEVKASQKKVKAEKDKVLAPLLEATKQERARWSPIEKALESAESNLKGKLGEFINERERAATAIRDDRRITSSTTLHRKLESIEVQPTAEVSIRKIKKLVVFAPEEIPRQYFDVNEGRVRQALLSGQIVNGARLEEVNSIAAY